MSEPKITYSELMKELDKHRPPEKIFTLTAEQRKFLIKCRNHKRPVIWRDVAKYWHKMGWTKTTSESLRKHWDKIRITLDENKPK